MPLITSRKQVTIATHNGSKVAVRHNRRDPEVAAKESHIDPDGHYEIWIDKDARQEYEHIFGDAVKQYNAKQRQDRQIKDYYQTIKNDKRKHAVYEMIIGIYNSDGQNQLNGEIMAQFVRKWQKKYPSLHIIGAYYHADEQGEPHVHIDYIPVGHSDRGMPLQSSLTKALAELDFVTGQDKNGKYRTAQQQWQDDCNAVLEELCVQQGYHVLHPQRAKHAKHVATDVYRLQQEQIKTAKQLHELQEQVKMMLQECEQLHKRRTDADIVKYVRRYLPDVVDQVEETYMQTMRQGRTLAQIRQDILQQQAKEQIHEEDEERDL